MRLLAHGVDLTPLIAYPAMFAVVVIVIAIAYSHGYRAAMPRFTIRDLLVATLLVAVGLGGIFWAERSFLYDGYLLWGGQLVLVAGGLWFFLKCMCRRK
jgi:hypothetical protein